MLPGVVVERPSIGAVVVRHDCRVRCGFGDPPGRLPAVPVNAVRMVAEVARQATLAAFANEAPVPDTVGIRHQRKTRGAPGIAVRQRRRFGRTQPIQQHTVDLRTEGRDRPADVRTENNLVVVSAQCQHSET